MDKEYLYQELVKYLVKDSAEGLELIHSLIDYLLELEEESDLDKSFYFRLASIAIIKTGVRLDVNSRELDLWIRTIDELRDYTQREYWHRVVNE